jgi:hypothetical protein
MADIFSNRPGVVAVLNTGGIDDNPFRVTLDGFSQNGAQSGVIFTEMAIQRAGNYQFLHTLNDLVYVYSFGERIGQIRASGMLFAQLCNGVGGLSTLLAYYEANRLEARPDPVSIIIGTSDAGRFRGFLVELNVDVARPDARLAQFGMQFQALPSSSASGSGGGFFGGGGGNGSGGGGGGAGPGALAAAGAAGLAGAALGAIGAPASAVGATEGDFASGGMGGIPGGMGSPGGF